MKDISHTQSYPALPLRDMVAFPGMVVPLFICREKSINALEAATKNDNKILLVAQKDPAIESYPAAQDLYEVGSLATILSLLKLPDGTAKALLEGTNRAKIINYTEGEDYHSAFIEVIEENTEDSEDLEKLKKSVTEKFSSCAKLNNRISAEVLSAVMQIEHPGKLSDTIALHLALKNSEKQKILGTFDIARRLENIYELMKSEINALDTEKHIRNRVKLQMEKTQKEYYLNEQLKAIQRELGESDNGASSEIQEMEQKINAKALSAEAKEKALAELKKLQAMSPMSAEATVVRNYLDWILSIPWEEKTPIRKNLGTAQKILDKGHYGMKKAKERIIEYLAVQQKSKKIKGSILCLVGPPGVGKTSLAKSMAAATGRKFVRMSLGGVKDESEIRGHRRTYIGSMPGKIIQCMKKAKSINPLFLLDEIDKMGADFRGDPAAALLEVLDPEHNKHFVDHHLEVEYDLSHIMFVATANTIVGLARPLLDRMEIINISGYTEDEKIKIANLHLIDKQKKLHGLKKKEWEISGSAIRSLIRLYTRESGVRGLERELANLTRKATKEILTSKKTESIKVTTKNLGKYSGLPKFSYGTAEKKDLVGVVSGLAYTEAGGDLLYIEAVSIPGERGIKYTGKLGEVMQESVKAAYSYACSRCFDFGFTTEDFQNKEIHVHVPEGATPKDGPSAGVAMCVTIVSVLTSIPIRCSVAMTGEITLRGRILAIGGLKEKLLAALRGGIETVLIPKENEKDLSEMPQNIIKALKIIPVSNVDDALKLALQRLSKPLAKRNVSSKTPKEE